ncbi:MAG: MBL fold metallo-hydrolase [Carboxylicivirga sp.]|jgi:7,8-dihydropterin-6-yl-methyl-4-(beta-D-ribofuranosyl)aminobenzene 5'-phosphate synthase|nr:MBL fold metallo-hydrolase [Carboxylicivirga sp.]
MKLTTLIDNQQSQKQLKCEHGLSFLLETDQHKIIYDTGQTSKFIDNAQRLGVDLSAIDYVILSHGHYDHTGGLPAFCKINDKARIIVHKKAFKQRFSKSSVMLKENGIAWKDSMSEYADRLLLIDGDINIENGLTILTGIEKQTNYDINNPRLVVNENGNYLPDTFDDEIILLAQADSSSMVLCGCAHNGIVNILHTINRRHQLQCFSLVAGGLHLNGANEDDIKHVINGLSPFTVNKWALNHCTGQAAFERFRQTYGDQVEYCGSGCIYEI